MIFGPKTGLVVVLCLFTNAAPAEAQPVWGLLPLMQSLAQVRTASARFTERQTAPVLSAPLISTGTLTYAAPNYLRKATLTPVPEVFTLEHGEVTLTGGTSGGTHVFALDQDPRIAGLVEGIRATLAGDLPALDHFYTVSLTGGAAGWQLHLLPKDPSLAHFLRSITISGSQNHIATVDTQSNDGGDSMMSIQPLGMNDAP
jgi:Outer membrane lipoprotein carrier protein LolA-like